MGFVCLCVKCKRRFKPLTGRNRASPSTLPNTSGVRADGIAHVTLLDCERGTQLSADMGTVKHPDGWGYGWWRTALIDFADLRTDPQWWFQILLEVGRRGQHCFYCPTFVVRPQYHTAINLSRPSYVSKSRVFLDNAYRDTYLLQRRGVVEAA
jgi:hypothetical protein